jgi:hypothetical protein
MSDGQRKHFFMCTGQVAFTMQNLTAGDAIDPAQVQHHVSNTVLFTNDGTIKVKDIANVQQSFQMNVLKRFEGQAPPAFLDCIVLNISPLGHMTQEEFEAGSPMEQIRKQQATAQAEQEAEILRSAGIPVQ